MFRDIFECYSYLCILYSRSYNLILHPPFVMESQQLRNDGRFPEELRTVHCSFKKIENRGVVRWRQGNSIVSTSISQNREKKQLTINLNFLDSSRNEPMNERRIYEMRQQIQGVFSAIISPETQIEVNVDIICDYGSIFSVIINSISVACMYSGISMSDVCISATVNSNADLNYHEENKPFSLCLVLSPNTERILHLQAFGRIQRYEFEDALKMGVNTCKMYHDRLRKIMCGVTSS